MATPANYATLIAQIDAIVNTYALTLTEVSGGKPSNALSLMELIELRYMLFEAGSGGSGGTSDASAANQTSVQALAGDDAVKATAIQGITGGKPVPISGTGLGLASESGFLTLRSTALTNTAIAIKSSAGSLMGWNFINANTVAVYVKFYEVAAASVAIGTTPVKLTLAIPAGSATNPAIFLVSPDLVPFEVFASAMSFACVTGLADNSITAPTTPIHASVRYK